MLSDETLAAWREDAESATYYGGNEQEQADRILALLAAAGGRARLRLANELAEAEATAEGRLLQLAEQRERAEKAEAALDRVRALADEWERTAMTRGAARVIRARVDGA